MLVIPDAALVLMLSREVRQARTLRLYGNAIALRPAILRGDLIEVRGGGYVPVSLLPDRWEMDAKEKVAVYPKVVFTFTEAVGKVYGYFVTGPTGTLEWVENFEHGPYEMREPDDQIKITPRYAYGYGAEQKEVRHLDVAHVR